MLNRSSIVRAIDFREPWFVDRTAELGEELKLHRKLWEFVVIAQVYRERIQYIQGFGKALGFGVGLEPLASWFAAQEAEVLATDYPIMRKEWKGQQAAGHRRRQCTERHCAHSSGVAPPFHGVR